jgi:hypothetical protein
MCFFRDQEDFFESKAASPPVMIYQVSSGLGVLSLAELTKWSAKGSTGTVVFESETV